MRSNEARLAAAQRFARHSRMHDTAVEGDEAASSAAAIAHADAAAADAAASAAAISSEDYNDYDAFVDARGPRTAPADSPRESVKLEHSATTAPVSEWTASLGEPVRPATAAVAHRRLCFMRRVLMHSLTCSNPSGADVAASTAAARSANDALAEAAAASVSAGPDYFELEEIERRRPALFHEYVGQYQQQTAEQADSDDDEPEESEPEEEQKESTRNDGASTSAPMFDAPPRNSSSGSKRGGRPHTEASVRRAPRPLPPTLSGLLLSGYDRSVARDAVQTAKKEGRNSAVKLENGAPTAAATTKARSKHSAAQAKMLDSDESELSSSDEDDTAAAAGAAGSSSMSMQFFPDDARPIDSNWAAQAGPTASAAAAEEARRIVDDDMERGGSSGARRRQTEAYAAAREFQRANSNRSASRDNPPAAPADSAVEPQPSESDLQWLSSELLRESQRLFLDGFDSEFVRYDLLDSGAAEGGEQWWETLDQDQAQRSQEKYFDADDEDPDMTQQQQQQQQEETTTEQMEPPPSHAPQATERNFAHASAHTDGSSMQD